MNNTIHVNSRSGSYPVNIGSGNLRNLLKKRFDTEESSGQIFILSDENVNRYHGTLLDEVASELAPSVHKKIIPEGEGSKSIRFWNEIVDFLLDQRIQRSDTVLVIGGGVTGDVGGFAAASVLRGVRLVHIPTTLLAMVDSSIGGKTGVNHPMGKNLVGAFYQPEEVIIDVQFLKTLPEQEWINGLSEILKYGAIRDASIFEDCRFFLETEFCNAGPETLIPLISKCVQVKADIVTEDEFEGGVRAFLNFGHTFAHALERACGYNKISHGEAVFLGMIAAQELSRQTGNPVTGSQINNFCDLYRYRVSKEELSLEELNSHMLSDKKRKGRFVRFVLLEKWQHPVLETVTDTTLIDRAWNEALKQL